MHQCAKIQSSPQWQFAGALLKRLHATYLPPSTACWPLPFPCIRLVQISWSLAMLAGLRAGQKDHLERQNSRDMTSVAMVLPLSG